jgi:prepilin-type N-terminal cleavage/methylation domain-containing protein
MNIKNVQKQKGFTLVEIAIVLVIIGLLLGGVLKGQELITNAKIKSVTSDFDNISAAYYAYIDRTGSKPSINTTAATYDSEFWTALRAEGFINGLSGQTSGPEHSLDGDWTAGTGEPFATGTNWICASGVVDTYAAGIDRKKDDGVGTSGSMRVVATDSTTAIAYTTTGTSEQTVCHEL